MRKFESFSLSELGFCEQHKEFVNYKLTYNYLQITKCVLPNRLLIKEN